MENMLFYFHSKLKLSWIQKLLFFKTRADSDYNQVLKSIHELLFITLENFKLDFISKDVAFPSAKFNLLVLFANKIIKFHSKLDENFSSIKSKNFKKICKYMDKFSQEFKFNVYKRSNTSSV